MDLLQSYPIAFLVTVVLPIISGIVLSAGGYDSLRARAESDAQLNRIEQKTDQTVQKVGNLAEPLATLQRYEQTLSAVGQRDEALAAVLTQYQKMKRASDLWDSHRVSKDHEEKARLASEVLDILGTQLTPLFVLDALPFKPLILSLGSNTFRVLFAVPMRIPPTLEFHALPGGSIPNVTEKSQFGFTVVFSPQSVPVKTFGFSASARL